MKKIILFISCLYLFTPSQAVAGKEFETSFNATYSISLDGTSIVSQNIKLKNKLSNVYATQYALEIGSTRIQEVIAFDKAGNKIPTKETTTDNKTIIVANFDSKIVGKDKVREFTVRYKNLDSSQKLGNILEINIPKVSSESDIDTYNVDIQIPLVFNRPKIISPQDYKHTQVGNNNIFTFDSNQVKQSGINAIFGEFQIFDFSLTYNLENPTVSNAVTQVALPPDTNYQKVYYESIQPKPEEIELDQDSNWIATFKLEPKQRVSIIAQGSAIVYMDPLISIPQTPQDILKSYTSPKKFWAVNNQEVQDLAKELQTPKNIYDYVVNNLTYNYDRLDSGVSRLGVLNALKHKDNAICTEFTDVFVSLARAANIPTRELNGYAYTQNSILKPLSLVQDVLHSWPEYYDQNKQLWVPVDPTWGSTTGGIDYFNQLDYNHFVFAIHGENSERPYPAGYYKFDNTDSKDLDIEFSSKTPEIKQDFSVNFKHHKRNPFKKEVTVEINATNKSNVALYNQEIKLSGQNLSFISPRSETINSFLPHSTHSLKSKIDPKENAKIIVSINDQKHEYQISQKTTKKPYLIWTGLIILGTVIAIVAAKSWSILVSKRRK